MKRGSAPNWMGFWLKPPAIASRLHSLDFAEPRLKSLAPNGFESLFVPLRRSGVLPPPQ